MARGRMISKSLGSSRKFHAVLAQAGRLGEFAQLLFPLIVINTDDHGRMPGDAFTVKHLVLPTSPRPEEAFGHAMDALAEVHLIDRYRVNDVIYLQIKDFDAHQVGLHRRRESRLPEYPGTSGDFRESPLQGKGTEGKGREPKRSEENGTRAAAAPRLVSTGQNAEENIAVITKLAHQAIDVLGVSNVGDLVESVKSLCAEHGIFYNSAVVGAAIESAIVQRPRRQHA